MSTLNRISGCENPDRVADVVFVHGLGGDAFGTWRHGADEASSWPRWLGDERPDVGVWSLGYAASVSKWSRALGWFYERKHDAGYAMSLPMRASEVLELMTQQGIGERPILFIGHSLGGLLIKQILRKANDSGELGWNRIAGQTRAVLFLATPHAGAELATKLSDLRTVFGGTANIDDLREHCAYLADLHEWYVEHAPRLIVMSKTFYETRPVGGILPIVNATSAHTGVGKAPVGLDEDHISIAKPRSTEALVCGAARELLYTVILAPAPVSDQAVATPKENIPTQEPVTDAAVVIHGSNSGTIITGTVTHMLHHAVPGHMHRTPHELPSGAEKFFGRRAELTRLIERVREGKNACVVGPAGIGKTALAAEVVRTVVGETAVRLARSPYPDGVVFLDLYQLGADREQVWNSLANKIEGAAFMGQHGARERATQACQSRRLLLIIEGGEVADGLQGRPGIVELLSVLSAQNRRLLLTRDSAGTVPAESVRLDDALGREDAANLFDLFSLGRVVEPVRGQVLDLLAGHPLAITWAGSLLAREEEDATALFVAWRAGHLPALSDPEVAQHTLEWLFERSTRGLDDAALRVLTAAGMLAHAAIPVAAFGAVFGDGNARSENVAHAALKVLVQRGLLRRPEGKEWWKFTHVLGYRFARALDKPDTVILYRLGEWIHSRLEMVLVAGGGEGRGAELSDALTHAAALLRIDGEHQLHGLGGYLLWEGMDRLNSLGRLDLYGLAVDAGAGWLAFVSAEKAGDSLWQIYQNILLIRRGKLLANQGDLEGALEAYRAGMVISQRLVATDPSNAEWQRELSVSHNKVGDVLSSQGDLVGALETYRAGMVIKQRLAAAEPSNADWQRDLSVSHNKVGDVLVSQGDLAGAMEAYRADMVIMQRLATADPSNTDWQRDLSVSHNNAGDVLVSQGDRAGALEAYRAGMAIRQRLLAIDASNAVWQRDLSVSHDRVGNVLGSQGDLAGAMEAYRAGMAIRQRLAAADPSNAVWQRDLSVSHSKVGDVLDSQGDLAGALEAYCACMAITQRLAAADSSNTEWQRDLSISHSNVGDMLVSHGDLTGALEVHRAGMAITQRLAVADPSNAVWQRDLSVSLTKIAQTHMAQGQHAEALAFVEQSLAIHEGLALLDLSNAIWQNDVKFCRRVIAQLRNVQE